MLQKFFESIPATDPLADTEKKQVIDQILEDNKNRQGGLMVVLNELQNRIGYVTEPMQQYVALRMHLPVSTVHGVISFYSFFTTTARGKHTVKFCMGTACYVGGIDQIIEKGKQILGIEPGQTTPDGNITFEICRCVGACSQAPVISVDDEIVGRMRPNKFPQVIRAIEEKEKAV
jgi:NADH-quinone oxidoreductase subunit E